jgi:hypothetical protein
MTLRGWLVMVWRLGVPAALMVAFALVGLMSESSTPGAVVGDATRPVARAIAPLEPWPVRGVLPVPRTTPAGEAAADAASEAGDVLAWPGDGPLEVTPRLPEELTPAGPDVVVPMPPPTPWAPVALHAHAPDGGTFVQAQWTPASMTGLLTPEQTPALQPVATQTGDVVEGVFWFGPRGLERIRILGEVSQ